MDIKVILHLLNLSEKLGLGFNEWDPNSPYKLLGYFLLNGVESCHF